MTLDGSAVCHSTRTGPNEPNDWELYPRTVRAGSRHCGEQYPAGSVALLHLVSSRHGEVAIRFWPQIAKSSSSNATASRKVTGPSTASS
jgi:hypothetical protein